MSTITERTLYYFFSYITGNLYYYFFIHYKQLEGGVNMSNIGPPVKSQIARIPEITGFVVIDPSGALIESTGEIDGESVGAVVAVAIQSLNNAAEPLGIGTLKHASLTGSGFTCLMAATDRELYGMYTDPTKPLGPVEKKLSSILGSQR